MSLSSLLLTLQSLMDYPNPDDALMPDISALYKRDASAWKKEAKAQARKYATVEQVAVLEQSLDGENKKQNKQQDQENGNDGNEAEKAQDENTSKEGSTVAKEKSHDGDNNNETDAISNNEPHLKRKKLKLSK